MRYTRSMDIRELKDLLKNSTSVLILEDGEPSYVIVDYKVYRNLTQAKEQEIQIKNHVSGAPKAVEPEPVRQQLSAQEMEALERLNREIQTLKEQIEQEEREGVTGESSAQ